MFNPLLDAAKRGRGGAFPNAGQNAHTRFQIAARNILEQFVAKLLRCLKDAVEHASRALLQMDGLAAPIRGRALSLHPSVLLEAIEDTRERRPFHTHTICDLALRELVAAPRQMRQRGPFAHA